MIFRSYGDVGQPVSSQQRTVSEALARFLVTGVQPAEALCAEARGSWFTLSGTADTICARAAQQRLAYNDLLQYRTDPGLTNAKAQEILAFVSKYSDVSGLENLLQASNTLTIAAEAVAQAPETAINLAAQGVGIVAQGAGKGVGAAASGLFKTLPWWAYVAGGAFLYLYVRRLTDARA